MTGFPHDSRRRSAAAPVIWLTGMSGAGKSTIAECVARHFSADGLPCEVLDGDEIRSNLLPELGFSKEDRDRNVRRVGFVARLLARNGVTVLAPLISPYREAREAVRERVGESFIEVHVKAPLEVLEARDTKGLYARARAGELESLTGVSDPYEPPLSPDLVLDTESESAERCAERVVALVARRREAVGVGA